MNKSFDIIEFPYPLRNPYPHILSKACYCLHHERLIAKPYAYGLDNPFFKSYGTHT